MSRGRMGMAILGSMSSSKKCSGCNKEFTVASATKLFDKNGNETKDPHTAKTYECPHCGTRVTPDDEPDPISVKARRD